MAALAALAGFVVGGVVGLLAGGSSSTKTVTSAGGHARTVTVQGPTHTTTVTRVVVHAKTQTVTTAAPAGTEGSGGAGQTFTGTGNGSIGTVTVARQSTIHWRTSSGPFSMKNAAEDEHSLAFSSGESSGESSVEAGTYHGVTVTTPGEWTLTISAG